MKQAIQAGKMVAILLVLLSGAIGISAQDTIAGEPTLNMRYFVNDNSIQYLVVRSEKKVKRKFFPWPSQTVQVYLDSVQPAYLLAKTTTNNKGLAGVVIPPSFKNKWDSQAKHTFIATLANKQLPEDLTTTLEVSKAKIVLDTLNEDGVRSVTAKVSLFENNEWVPAPGVEVKVGIKRSASILSAGEEASYTTDSSGTVTVEFNKTGLPGDAKGLINLVARVDDNDIFGNLLVAKTVPWGTAIKAGDANFFDQRTLWSTRFRTPFWLLFIAYGIVIGVWGTIIYLVFQIVKIKKLGLAAGA